MCFYILLHFISLNHHIGQNPPSLITTSRQHINLLELTSSKHALYLYKC